MEQEKAAASFRRTAMAEPNETTKEQSCVAPQAATVFSMQCLGVDQRTASRALRTTGASQLQDKQRCARFGEGDTGDAGECVPVR